MRTIALTIGMTAVFWAGMLIHPAVIDAEEVATLPRDITVDGLTVEAISPEVFACPVEKGKPVFLNRDVKLGENDYVYPLEFDGLPRLVHDYFKYSQKAIQFSLSKPSRFYAWIKVQHETDANMGELARWHLYQRKLTQHNAIYYRDFAAGENEITFESSIFACAGIRDLERLTPREQLVPTLRTVDGKPTLELGYYGKEPTDVSYTARLTEAGSQKQVYDKTFTARADPGKTAHIPLTMPPLPEGVFHFLEIAVTHGDQTWVTRLPYGLFPEPGSDPSVEEPFFPYGGYDKTMMCASDDPEIRSVYLSATFYHMRKLHMNTLVIGPPKKLDLNLAARYKIKCVVRVSGQRKERKDLIEHPSTLSVMIGDEPKWEEIEDYRERYAKFREQFKTPILTCAMLDGYGTAHEGDPLRIWPVLKPQIRFGRLYCFRKTHYDLLYPLEYKLWMSPSSTFQSLESDPGPWWLVPQFFGHEREAPYWRIPTGPELRGLMHLAIAHRCEGLLGWCLHDHGKTMSTKVIFSVFLDGNTMAPTKYSQLATLEEFGARLMKAKHVLKRFAQKRLGVYYRSTPQVEAVARWTRDGKVCVYAVNLNTREARDCEMQLAIGKGPDARKNLEAIRSATEIFSGQPVDLKQEISENKAWSFVRFALKDIAPGDGRLVLIDGDFPAVPEEVKEAMKGVAR